MAKMAKVTKQLIELGVAYTYSEDKNEKVEIKFLDDGNNEHIITQEYESDYGAKKIVTINVVVKDRQEDICNWIKNNKLMLTDYKGYLEEVEREKREREEFQEKIAMKLVFSKEFGAYVLKIKRNKIGNESVYLEQKEELTFEEPRLGVESKKVDGVTKHEVVVTKGSVFNMNIEDCDRLVSQLSRAMILAKEIQESLNEFAVK